MKISILAFAIIASLAVQSHAQNLTTVSASNITDINGTKLAAGQLCFLITDSQDNPISVSIGGGGQALKRGYCSAVAAGVVTGFTVPNPASTLPSGIYYRVTVKDSSTGQEVLRYTGVSFTGATFNFDNYAPVNLGSFAPLTGNSVSGNLSVTGNVAATGTVTGSNIPGSIPGAGACAANQYVTALNTAAPPTCTSTATGTGIPVQATSPTLVTPNIGSATGTSLALSAAGTLSTSSVKQVSATTSLAILDNLGISHFFISGTSPYTNSFVSGNGAGTVFLGSAAKAGVADTTGAITTAGGITLQTASQTLPATITNDGAGGVSIASNAAGVLSLANNGTVTFNSPGAAAQWRGATSGTILVAAPAVAGANALTLPAATDTLVARATTDTLTNKTLTSPAISDPTITGTAVVKRLRASQGTPVVIGDWTITGLGLGSWGTTASVVSVTGNDTAGSVVISCSGTGQSANPAFRLTFHDGAFAANPVAIATRGDGFSPTVPAGTFGTSTTSALFGLNGTCVAGVNYAFYYWVIGN